MTVIQTAVPDTVITDKGLLVPEISDVLSGRIADIKSALPDGASDALQSPQGQMAVSETAIIAQRMDKELVLMNQINPDFARGRFQDGIGRIYFQERIAAQGTVVTATCRGVAGTIIPAGSTAIDEDGYIYQTTTAVEIPPERMIDVAFTCQTTGIIQCPAGKLNRIYRPLSGWESVYNNVAGVVGADVESRTAFESRRRQSVFRNSRNQDGSVRSALLETPGVLDAYVWSNRSDVIVRHGVTDVDVLPHSLYISVYGGSDEDIAESIFRTYNPGCNMNGEKELVISDTSYSPPYPTYFMQWHEATTTPVYFKVEIDASFNPPSNITTLIKEMVASVFNGGYDGIEKARIGASISTGRYYEPVTSINPDSVVVTGISVSKNGVDFSPSVTMGADEIPTIELNDITVEL